MATLSLRIDLAAGARIGPGKIALLEGISSHGSIAAAGRSMNMSYRRAWQLVGALNAMFSQPVVISQVGGKRGGGAELTAFGQVLIIQYRAAEHAAAAAASAHLAVLQSAAAPA